MNRVLLSRNTIALVMLYFTQFVGISYMSNYSVIRYVLILMIAIYLFPKYKCFMNNKFMHVNISIIALSLFAVVGSFVNEDLITTRNSFLSSIPYFMALLETFFLFEYTAEIGRIEKAINVFYYMTLVLLIVNDALVMCIGSLDGNYVVGSKFQVMYLHIFWLALYFAKVKLNAKWTYLNTLTVLLYFGITLYIGIQVDCNTGIIGSVVLLLLCIISRIKTKLLCSPTLYLAVLVFSFLFMFCYELVLNNSYVQNFIVNILHRSMTLTGRTDIYILLPKALLERPWFGYGYGTTYDISVRYFGYADTQNGIAEWMLQIGIIGTIFIVLSLYNIFSKLKSDNKTKNYNYSIMAYVYVLTILGAVEISFGRLLFGAAALLYATTFSEYQESC